MRLLERNNASEFSLTKDLLFSDDAILRYAILSHTWGAETEEVSFKDMMDGTGTRKAAYNKIRLCGEQARRDDLQYFWIDTCCIDKSSSTELEEAINSMFHWYRNAVKYYVYLADVSRPTLNTDVGRLSWESSFRKSRWFTRGWTLQERIAPVLVEFFSKEGEQQVIKGLWSDMSMKQQEFPLKPSEAVLCMILVSQSECHGWKIVTLHVKKKSILVARHFRRPYASHLR